MKVFISQPMRGKSKDQVLQEREKVVKDLKLKGHEIIDSIIIDNYPDEVEKRIWFLGNSLIKMSMAEGVYFMDGWKDSSGCKVEYLTAIEYGLQILGCDVCGSSPDQKATVHKTMPFEEWDELLKKCNKLK